MTLSRRAATRLCLAWLALVPVAMAWQVVFYAGLYRWLCELQLDAVGDYAGVLTAIFPTLLLMAPAVAMLVRLQRGAPVPVMTPREAADRVIRVMGVIAAVAVAVCLGAVAWAQHLPSGAEPPVLIDIARLGPAAPTLGSAILIGQADTADAVFKTHGKSHVTRTFYAPLTGVGQASNPVRFLVDVDVYGGGSPASVDLAAILQNAPLKGVLLQGGLPHDMQRVLERRGLVLARPYYLLFISSGGAREGWYVLAGLSGFVAVLSLAILIAALASRARAGGVPTSPRRR